MNRPKLPALAAALLAALTLPPSSVLAQTPAPATTAPTAEASEDETVVLSPFTVSTGRDKGYKATNATSGTRLDTPIKELPLNLEVITEQFIRDTGATDLRQALRYSAGVILESQADAFVEPDFDATSAGANDPRGATRSAGDSTTKLRGFVINQVLRDGFRRQYSADSINIARIEVLRGPSALLYGVGSFGGVINYMPKRPERTAKYYTGVSVGSNEFYRAEFDFTGPIGDGGWQPAYRISGALQQRGDHTEWFEAKHITVSPVLALHPTENTTIVFDNEFGYAEQSGVGFQNLRANVNAGASRTASWLTDVSNGLIDTRTFRWSGPDTYLRGPFRNNIIDLTQKITDDLYLKVGAGQSEATFESRQIRDTGTVTQPFDVRLSINYDEAATVSIAGTSYNLRSALASAGLSGRFQNLTAVQLAALHPAGSFRGDNLLGFVVNDPIQNELIPGPPQTTNQAAIRYQWSDSNRIELRNQIRADLNYQLDLGAWGEHNFIVGTQYQALDGDDAQYGPAYGYVGLNVPDIERYSYKNPTDYSYFNYGLQGDGRGDPARQHLRDVNTKTWDIGYYGVYHGKFFDDRLQIIGGARWDRNDRRTTTDFIWEPTRVDQIDTRAGDEAPSATSPQIGLSYAITRQLTVFGLYSTGVVPNYTERYGDGNAFAPTKAKNYEAGVKFDLFDGRLSGTVSAYKIERTNTPKFLWWAPSPYNSALKGYDSTKPSSTVWEDFGPESVWYAIKQTNVATAKKVLPSGFHTLIDALATVPAQATNARRPDAAIANATVPGYLRWWSESIDPVTQQRGLIRQARDNTAAGTTTGGVYRPLINFDDPAIQSFVFAAKFDSTSWGGNFNYAAGRTYYFGDGTAGIGNAPDGAGAHVPLDDQATGWDTSLIITPSDNLQIVVNFAHVNRKITSQTYEFVAAPYWALATWYVQNNSFGTLSGARTPAQAYGDVRDTTTYMAPIREAGQSADDTPENTGTLWARYTFDDILPIRGISVGVGGEWKDNRLWFTGFSGGGGNFTEVNDPATNQPVLVKLYTKEQITVNAYAEYRRKFGTMNARFGLNVDNLLDEQSRFGEVFAPGTSWKLSARLDF